MQSNTQTDTTNMVSSLNKEDAMEEALSHTTQYSPFEVEQQEVNQESNMSGNKKTYMLLGIILGIMLVFILLLPTIANLIGA